MATRSEKFDQVVRKARAVRGVALMGVCNVTPDSFSDGGQSFRFEDACARVDTLLAEGADFVDIGAESTRPGALPVPSSAQLARLLEVVRYAAGRTVVTVDTTEPEVASVCLEAGAVAINDVSCLADAALADVASSGRAALILMHARGPQAKMAGFSRYPDAGYGDVVADVLREWSLAAERAMYRGVARKDLVMDPGLGFSKNALQSTELVRRVRQLAEETGVPILIGASRKSFLTVVDAAAAPTARLGASVAAALHAADEGASLLRVHDVQATRQAVDLARLLQQGLPSRSCRPYPERPHV